MARKAATKNLIDTLGDENLNTAGEMIKAMGHPMRLAIIDLLKGGNKVSVTEIYKTLNLNQAVASQHLILLKDRGVLRSEKAGKQIFYMLKFKESEEILKLIVKVVSGKK